MRALGRKKTWTASRGKRLKVHHGQGEEAQMFMSGVVVELLSDVPLASKLQTKKWEKKIPEKNKVTSAMERDECALLLCL